MEATEAKGGFVRVEPGEGRTARMSKDELVCCKIGGEQTGGAYSLFEIAVRPGGVQSPHVQHREDECIYVLEGRFAVRGEGVEWETGPGALIYVPKGCLHAYENVGDATGRLLVVHTPGGSHERFVERVGSPAADRDAPPDVGPRPGGFAAIAAEHGIEVCETTENAERSI